MNTSKLMRMVYPTDAIPEEPEYWGAFSQPFPTPDGRQQIVGVDWNSEPGFVVVTWLVPA